MKIKSLYIFFYILCFVLNAFSQFQPDTAERKLRGAVKKVEVYFMVPQIIDGSEKIAPQIYKLTSYNRQGWMTEDLSYSDGKVQTKAVYRHDAKGRRIFTEYFGNADFTEQFVYKKDSQGRVFEQLKINPFMKRPSTRVVLKYDSRGNVIEENTIYLGSESPDEIKIFTYDRADRQISHAVYDSKKALKYKSMRKIDAEGQVIEIIDETEQHITKHVFKYDEKGRPQTILSFDQKKNEIAGKKVYKYDDEKLIVETLDYDQNDRLLIKIISRVDKYGNILTQSTSLTEDYLRELAKLYGAKSAPPQILIDQLKLRGETSDETFQYEYDEKGNWIKRFDFGVVTLSEGEVNPNNKPVRTEIRLITYFN